MTAPERRLKVYAFGPDDPLSEPNSLPAQYVRRYLDDLGCKVVVEEPLYFDRDFLAEFQAFYCKTARGYRNSCRRLHFFADPELNREKLVRAIGGNADVCASLCASYLGFAVLRPFDPPLLGRTVLAWYPDEGVAAGRRVTTPSRDYRVHLAGLELTIHGLAWQAQDSAVGACSTVSLWTMLHSSAFDDHHAIPTTAEITRAGHQTASLGSRMFPSSGLTTYQMFEAIKAQELSPVVVEGDIVLDQASTRSPGFSRERFLTNIAAFNRSGYPVVLWGMLLARNNPSIEHGLHALCVTGFREVSPTKLPPGLSAYGNDIEVVYVHNDNLGPGVRCRVSTGAAGEVFLRTEAPSGSSSAHVDPSANYDDFQPMSMVVAVHNELTLTPDKLHRTGFRIAEYFRHAFDKSGLAVSPAFSIRTRFSSIQAYLGHELAEEYEDEEILAHVRLALTEHAQPLSLHLGIVQLSTDGGSALTVVFDTTDNERYLRALAHISAMPVFEHYIEYVEAQLGFSLGPAIHTYP